MTKRIMNELHLKRIAAVDRPCQEGAKAAIFKRAQENGGYLAKASDEAALPEAVETYLKRDFSGDKRKELANTGAALPDGSFPIQTRGDLKNAVQAYGRAKNKPKAKAHIVSRARSLDATSLLPADWKVSKLELLGDVTNAIALDGFEKALEGFIEDMDACGFDDDYAQAVAKEYANCLLYETDAAVIALGKCLDEIEVDKAIDDKAGALQESVAQFKAHITGIIPEGVENALVAKALVEAGFEITGGDALTKRENDMGASIELKKSLGLPVTANDADVAKAIDLNVRAAGLAAAIFKMSGKHAAFMQSDKAKMPAGGKEAFADMSADERDKHMEKNPIEKSAVEKAADEEAAESEKKKKAEEDAKKRAADEISKSQDETLTIDGTEIRKSVVGAATFAIFKSQQAAIEKAADERAVSIIEKRAGTELAHIGKSDELAVMLHGIAKRDPKLSEQVEAVLKAADAKIAKGALFAEVGKSTTGHAMTGNAAAQIEKLAEAKVSGGMAKSIFKARDMVRRENPEIAKQEEAERAGKKAA